MPKSPHNIGIADLKNRAAVTVKEFAHLTGQHPISVYRATEAGKLESVRIASRVMIPRSVWAPLFGGEL